MYVLSLPAEWLQRLQLERRNRSRDKNAFSTAALPAAVSRQPCLEGRAHVLRADEGLELLGVDLLLDLGEQHAGLLNVRLAFALVLERKGIEHQNGHKTLLYNPLPHNHAGVAAMSCHCLLQSCWPRHPPWSCWPRHPPWRACQPETCPGCTRPPGMAPPAPPSSITRGQLNSWQHQMSHKVRASCPAASRALQGHTPSTCLWLRQREPLLHRLLACQMGHPGKMRMGCGQHALGQLVGSSVAEHVGRWH